MVAVATKRTQLPSSSAGPTFTVERTNSKSASRTFSRVSSPEGSTRNSPSRESASCGMLRSATASTGICYKSGMLTVSEIRALHDLPLTELLFRAQTVHRQHHKTDEVQLCTLLSVKTGGCPEDCAYCPQSAHYQTPVSAEKSLAVEEVLAAAARARDEGATRFCMGAAWREVKDGPAFDHVLEMVRGVRALGMEACVTLGMLNDEQARRLKAAGLTAYNHNLDTSRQHYPSIISTRTYDDRLATLARVRS